MFTFHAVWGLNSKNYDFTWNPFMVLSLSLIFNKIWHFLSVLLLFTPSCLSVSVFLHMLVYLSLYNMSVHNLDWHWVYNSSASEVNVFYIFNIMNEKLYASNQGKISVCFAPLERGSVILCALPIMNENFAWLFLFVIVL